jgi:hypothetical protein
MASCGYYPMEREQQQHMMEGGVDMHYNQEDYQCIEGAADDEEGDEDEYCEDDDCEYCR